MRKEDKLGKHKERCKQPNNVEDNLRMVWEGSPKRKMELWSRDWKFTKESKDTSRRMKEQTCKNVSLRSDLSFRLWFLCVRNSAISSPQPFCNVLSQTLICSACRGTRSMSWPQLATRGMTTARVWEISSTQHLVRDKRMGEVSHAGNDTAKKKARKSHPWRAQERWTKSTVVRSDPADSTKHTAQRHWTSVSSTISRNSVHIYAGTLQQEEYQHSAPMQQCMDKHR